MSFIAELKRRNVYRVAVMYVIAAWLIMQVVDVMFPALMLPDWAITLVAILVLVGFPVSLVLAWVFELTPEGLKLEKDVNREESITAQTGRNIDFIIIGLLVAAVTVLAVTHEWSWFDADGPDNEAPSVAVLAFVDRSAEQDQAHLADGLSETLIHVLAQVSGLKVTAKTSSFYFKGRDVTIAEIAEKLEVAHVLEGSIQKAGNQIRVIAQLIKASDGSHVWSKHFDRELRDIFAVQDEIAQEVVQALKISLLDTEEQRIHQRYQPTLEAYGELVLGWQALPKRTARDLAVAEQHFKKAIELDPDYSLAYVGLAETYYLQMAYASLGMDESLERRQSLVDKALELDPRSGEAYAARATIHVHRQEMDAAERDLLAAVELSPNYSAAHYAYALLLGSEGRVEEAGEQFEIAARLDPMSPNIQQAITQWEWRAGRAETALALTRRNIDRNPEYPGSYVAMAHFQTQLGRLGEAQWWLDEGRSRNPEGPLVWSRACIGLMNLGDGLVAGECVRRLFETHPDNPWANFSRAMLHLHRMEWEAAKTVIRVSLEQLPNNPIGSSFLSQLLGQTGHIQQARQVLAEVFPEMLGPGLDLPDNYLPVAITFAAVLNATGEMELRDQLLNALDAQIATRHRLIGGGYGFADVYAHSIRGDRDLAVAALRDAIDAGWRDGWWLLSYDWRLSNLHQDPEFVDLMGELEADIAKQRQWYEENKDRPLL